MKSKDTVHKITVPQEKLDEAKAYSIHAEKMIYRGPFGGFKGKGISKDYTFRPVNTNDGLVYYTMADVHHAREGAVATARSVENLDFLVILGDSRGNHEISALNRKEHIGLAVYADLASGTQVCRFINTAGEVVPVYNPFAEGPAQTEFVLDLTSRN